MTLSRREVLAISAVAGVAGCTSIGSDSDDDSADVEGDRTGEETENEGSEQDDGRADIGEESSTTLLIFDGDFTPELEKRAIRALNRTEELLGKPLEDAVTLELNTVDLSAILGSASVNADSVGPGPSTASKSALVSGPGQSGGTPMEELIERATHREPMPDLGFAHFGVFYPTSRRIEISVPEDTENALALLRMHAPIDVPDDALEGYPDDSLFAHELTHAIQWDVVDSPPSGSGHTPDHTEAKTSIMEGLAHWIVATYRANCVQGVYDDCSIPGYWLTVEATPSFQIPGRIPYTNGSILTQYLLDSGGWDAVWEAHREPPETAWVAMFPEEYVETGGFEVQSAGWDGHPPDGWITIGTERLGVNRLYEKLFQLDVVSNPPDDGRLADAITDELLHEYMFRSELLRGWRGDELTGFHRMSDGRLGYQWEIQMATTEDALALADAITDGYDGRGIELADGWELDDTVVDVESDDDSLSLVMAPDSDGLAAMRGPV